MKVCLLFILYFLLSGCSLHHFWGQRKIAATNSGGCLDKAAQFHFSYEENVGMLNKDFVRKILQSNDLFSLHKG